MDLMARDLRNLASPTTDEPLALDLMEDQEIVFQSEGRYMPAGSLNVVNTNRVRYCVSTTGDLYRQLQTWTTAAFPAIPAATACPGRGLDHHEARGPERRRTTRARSSTTTPRSRRT